jgi:hypothetical protein
VKGVAYGYGPGWLFKFLHRILHWFKSCAFSTQ